MSYKIKKSSGQREFFDIKKLRQSLQAVSKDKKLVEEIVQKIIEKKPKSTRVVHDLITDFMEKEHPATAARYNLKRALMELGPAGYPFEQFVAQLFEKQKYAVKTNQIINGLCVKHEVDIIAERDKHHFMIECKFHNRPGLKSNVKVTLYVQARFEDIHKAWKNNPQETHSFHQAWVISNTQFTSEAIKYARCTNIQLLGWKYPEQGGLEQLIDSLGIHPITALTTLSRSQKRQLIKQGLILCRDASKQTSALKGLGFSDHKIKKLIAQAEAVCQHH